MASPSQTNAVMPLEHSGIPTAADLHQNPLLGSQADSILAAMPLFSSAMAGKLSLSKMLSCGHINTLVNTFTRCMHGHPGHMTKQPRPEKFE